MVFMTYCNRCRSRYDYHTTYKSICGSCHSQDVAERRYARKHPVRAWLLGLRR